LKNIICSRVIRSATNHNHPGSGTVVFVIIFRLLRDLTKVISITNLEVQRLACLGWETNLGLHSGN
jgi:hypothetical protein